MSPAVQLVFDAPLEAHQKLIGRWAAEKEPKQRRYTRHQAKRRIANLFEKHVNEILAPVELVDLRVVILNAFNGLPPAAATICDSMGQLYLGWIENSNLPIAWRSAAYQALEKTLGAIVPVFGFDDLFEEIALWYWDGDTTDEGARFSMIEVHGMEADDIDTYMLPSAMTGRRTRWMTFQSSEKTKPLPAKLAAAIETLENAHLNLENTPAESDAWQFDTEQIFQYLPDYEDHSSLPQLTLVPVEQFQREIDDVGRHGMEVGFIDIAGLTPLLNAHMIDDWLHSLRKGTELLLAAQRLVQLYPAKD